MRKIIKQRIKRGVKWLNKTQPNWFRKIKLSVIDMSHSQLCICGQVFGYYFSSNIESRTQNVKLGFNTPSSIDISFSKSEKYFKILVTYWKEEIRKLRKTK